MLRFDEFEVDVQSGDVWKHGTRFRLQEKPFQVLRLLLERPGEIVTRDELRQSLWPDTIVDFDDGLNTAVKKIRDLFGDSADHPRFIETIPRRGYRFIAPVERSGPGAAVPVARHRSRAGPIGAAIASVIVACIAAWVYQPRFATPPIESIAVLPLENRSGDPAQDYFAAAVTDALTTEIARTVGASLRVTSRSSAEKYRRKPVEQVARELDVDAVIQGSVVRSANQARISVQMVDARSDRHLWAASYERDLHDMLALQADIAATVARRIHVKLDPRAQARLASHVPVNPQAYDLYQRARYRAFSNNPDAIAAAVTLLEDAIRLDSNLAPAHALLARAYATEAFLGRPERADLEPKALEHVSRALKLDPDLAEAYLARGLVLWTHRNGFPHERAILEIKRAIELDPNLAEAHHWLGTIFNHVGLLDRGERALRTALRLDPTNIGIRYRIAATLLFQGKPARALPELEATRAFFPSNAAYHIAAAQFQLDRKQDAMRTIEDYLRFNPRDQGGVANAMQALLHADAGQAAHAEASIAQSVKAGTGFGHFHHAAYTIGAAYASMGKPAEAVKWLRAAADDGYPCYPLFERDRSLDLLRADPSFIELMKELKARWERYARMSAG